MKGYPKNYKECCKLITKLDVRLFFAALKRDEFKELLEKAAANLRSHISNEPLRKAIEASLKHHAKQEAKLKFYK